MAEYIDRVGIMQSIMGDMAPFTISMVARHIREYPAADVEPVQHGRWIKDDDTGESLVRCSVCREVYECEEPPEFFRAVFHYCPNCGARMDLEADA